MKRNRFLALSAMCGILTLSSGNLVYAQEDSSSATSAISRETTDTETDSATSDTSTTPAATAAPQTADSQETDAASTPDTTVTPGSSQADAGELTPGVKITGTAEGNTHSWYTFTTGSDSESTYNITLTNHSPNTDKLEMYLYDEYGTQVGDCILASTNGVPATFFAQELESNTSYYISISPWSSDSTEYSLIIQNPDDTSAKSKPSAVKSPADGTTEPGISPDDAQILSSGSKITGTAESGSTSWFGFTTDNGSAYNISVVNTSADADKLEMYLYDQYGTQIGDCILASTDGVPATFFTADLALNADTTYYLSLSPWGSDTNYTISVKDPNA